MDKILRTIKSIKFSSLNWRAFWISLIGIFFMELVQMLGLNSALSFKSIISPLGMALQGNNLKQTLHSKLQSKFNSFSLKDADTPSNTYKYTDSSYYSSSNSFVVIDYENGEILVEKDSEKILPIASLTKIMTAIIALDLAGEDELFEVSKHAAETPPTKIGVVPGEKMTLKELLNAALLTSANDAVEVIKEGIDKKYTADVFVNSMNDKADFLKLTNSRFQNPQGFDSDNNYSTARDMAILSHYALENYPEIAEIVKKDYQLLPENRYHKRFDLYNWNGLIGVYPNVLGLKIGNTNQAGMTTIVIAEREGRKVLVVLLGAEGILERDMGASELLDLGFSEDADLPAIGIIPEQFQQKYTTWQYWN